MIVKTLTVTNFRNHRNTVLQLSPATNILIGNNAQGKTNLLEAIYLTCVGRGWRTHRDREMINFNAERSNIETKVSKNFGDCNVEIVLSKSTKKTIKINGIPIQRMGELMGQVNCVFFSPDELRLIKDTPADRRRFLDIDISQIDKNYFYSLLRYNKILLQRNALLKSFSAKSNAKAAQSDNTDLTHGLEIWDSQLAKAGALIIARRLVFIEQLKSNVTKVHNFLTNGKEKIELSYINITDTDAEARYYASVTSNLSDDEKVNTPQLSVLEIESALLKELADARDKDLRLRTTTIGPHRDDIRILIDGKDVRHFASQGQQRTIALSLKLAELEIFKTLTGEMPILLLDDVLSELDAERQERLIKTLTKCQSIITATSYPSKDIPQGAKLFEIANGEIKKKM